MQRERVVITGIGAVTPYGTGSQSLEDGLFSGKNVIVSWPVAHEIPDLRCELAGRIPAIDVKVIPREQRRSMSPMSLYACLAANEAIRELSPEEVEATGVAVGSTMGSPDALNDFFAEYLTGGGLSNIKSMVFFKTMGHTVASNVALSLGCKGRMLAPSCACAAGLQAVGLGYESIVAGREVRMLCGGADELHPLTLAAFDRIGAATTSKDPAGASRPFDSARSGIVCSEGAGMLLLESLSSATARNAYIYGEIRGFGCTTAPHGLAFPDVTSIQMCIRQALDDAEIACTDIAYICAHATSTSLGDMMEGLALADLFGERTPVSSLKGLMGHTLAASGPIELIACLSMMRRKCCLPTANLMHPDVACGRLAHITAIKELAHGPILKNSFALGGCNVSVVLSPFTE